MTCSASWITLSYSRPVNIFSSKLPLTRSNLSSNLHQE